MLMTTAVFYKRAHDLASEEEKKQIELYLCAAMAMAMASKKQPSSDKDSMEIRRQRGEAGKTIRKMVSHLSEIGQIKGVSSLDEMDLSVKQEICRAGWMLYEREGKPVISTYLPTRHIQPTLL